jgi:hypothetical protein
VPPGILYSVQISTLVEFLRMRRMISLTFSGPNGTRFARCHFKAQKSLDFQSPPFPMALVVDVALKRKPRELCFCALRDSHTRYEKISFNRIFIKYLKVPVQRNGSGRNSVRLIKSEVRDLDVQNVYDSY